MGISKGDEVFVNEIKAGNEMAFEAMVLKYQPKLMSSLIGYTKSRDQAEELCQKTFIKVWQKIDSFRGDSALFTWIYSCLLYTSPSPRDGLLSRMPSSA